MSCREPHSFILHSGEVGRYVKRLVVDVRKVMEPNTASKLRVRNSEKSQIVEIDSVDTVHDKECLHIMTDGKLYRCSSATTFAISSRPVLSWAIHTWPCSREASSASTCAS